MVRDRFDVDSGSFLMWILALPGRLKKGLGFALCGVGGWQFGLSDRSYYQRMEGDTIRFLGFGEQRFEDDP